MGDFITIINRDEHECYPRPGWFGRWVNGLKVGSLIKCATVGCGQYWKFVDREGKKQWVRT